jgi:hypothetical protein
MAYLLLAGIDAARHLRAPVVFDFAIGIIGLALTIFRLLRRRRHLRRLRHGADDRVPLRAVYNLEDFVTLRHLRTWRRSCSRPD